jgi:hypothetical protein
MEGFINLVSAVGGADGEDIEETKRRAPQALRNLERAVTREDYEQMARTASSRVKKVRCLGPLARNGVPQTYGGLIRREGSASIIVVSDIDQAYDPNNDDLRARPELAQPRTRAVLIHEVQSYLDLRRPLTTKLVVTGPRYVKVMVDVEIKLWPNALIIAGADQTVDQLKDQIDRRIRLFLHPVKGNQQGSGWEIGQSVFLSGLFEFLKPELRAIGYIKSLTARGAADYKPANRPDNLPKLAENMGVGIADYEIICSGQHPQAGKSLDGQPRWHKVTIK